MKLPGYRTSGSRQWRSLLAMAKGMRRIPTTAEDILWQRLQRGRLGVRFRRQHPIGSYISDFVCLARCLVVEVDGAVHLTREDHDSNRDAYLESLGFRVLRLANDRVMRDPDGVLKEIVTALNESPSANSVDGTES